MKKICILPAIAALAFAAHAEMSATALSESPAQVAEAPARAVALQCVSTNLSGTLTVQRITPLTLSWPEVEVTETTNLTEVATNIYHVVTNNLVIAWRTKYQGAGVIASNEYSRAINAKPVYPAWPDIVLSTNKVAQTVLYTNYVDHVVTNIVPSTNTVMRYLRKEFTNTLATATLSGGYLLTNGLDAVLAPGDRLRATGTALKGGRATIIIER